MALQGTCGALVGGVGVWLLTCFLPCITPARTAAAVAAVGSGRGVVLTAIILLCSAESGSSGGGSGGSNGSSGSCSLRQWLMAVLCWG